MFKLIEIGEKVPIGINADHIESLIYVGDSVFITIFTKGHNSKMKTTFKDMEELINYLHSPTHIINYEQFLKWNIESLKHHN